jgi:hypothetical protein
VTSSATAKLLSRVFPVDEPDGLVLLARPLLDLHPVAEHPVDLAVGLVEVSPFAEGRGLGEPVHGARDESVADALFLQPRRRIFLLDVGVVGTVLSVAEVAVAELVLEHLDHAILSLAFDLSDVTHRTASAFSFWISLSVLPPDDFHATRPLAALPTITPAAVEGDAKR